MANWQNLRLGDIANVGAGNCAPQNKTLFENGQYPFIRTADVGSIRFGAIDKTTDYLNDDGIKKLRKFVRGTILFPKSGASTFLNHRVIMDTDGYVASHLATIKADPELANDKFLLYYLRTVRAQDLVQDHSYPSLNLSVIKGINIPLPPLPEQKRIVAILDEAFAGIETAIANAEKNLANAREIFTSHLNAVFSRKGEGWVEKPLCEIGNIQTGSTPKTSECGNYGDYIPFVKPADFNNNGSLNYENYGLSQNGLTTARQVPAHSVLMVCIGATIGKCGFSERAIATNQQVNALTPTNNFSYRYIYYQMLSDSFQRLVINNSGQATLPIINKTKWSKLSLSFPPTIKEQIRIENLLDSLSVETQRLESVYRRKLELLADLKQSLLHKAFTGELTADQLYETPESEDLLKVAES